MALGRVYCFGPAFRAEKSKTRRHLIEFWMMEPEWAFATLDDVIALEERLLVATVARVLDRCAEELKRVERDTRKLAPCGARSRASTTTTRSRFSTTRACRSSGAGTSGAPDETALSEPLRPAAVRDPLPGGGQGVLHRARPGDPRLCLSCDCLAPEGYGEIIGGGQRMASLWTAHRRASTSTRCPRRRSSGTRTCGATAPCPTAASASASSAWWPGSAACTTSGKPSPFPASWTGCTPEPPGPGRSWGTPARRGFLKSTLIFILFLNYSEALYNPDQWTLASGPRPPG